MFQSWWLSDRCVCICAFQTIDDLLRCGICFEYFNIAMMIPQCSHNCKYLLFLWVTKMWFFYIMYYFNIKDKYTFIIYFSPLAPLSWSFSKVFSMTSLLNIEYFLQGSYVFYHLPLGYFYAFCNIYRNKDFDHYILFAQHFWMLNFRFFIFSRIRDRWFN